MAPLTYRPLREEDFADVLAVNERAFDDLVGRELPRPTLEAASLAPERLRGMVIEMPVLDHALLGCALAFTPLMVALTAGAPAMKLLSAVTRRIPRLPWQADILLDTVRQQPEPSAAVLQGLFFGRTAPHRSERRTFETPTLVIGHQFDIVHPFSDADMLVDELPNARLLQASSILELRLAPERLTGEIAGFIEDCWRPKPAKRSGAARVSGARRRSSSRSRPAPPRP
jgi:pimeloyl-ACP methyl ester carboxylesterase